jgi:hypothetical protein
MQRLEAVAAELRQPRDFSARTLVGAECEPEAPSATCPRPRTCKCVFTTTAPPGETNAEAFALGLGAATTGCDIYGRSGECLVSASAFAGCTPADACSCAASCEDALRAIDEDNARVLDVEARHAECDGECRVVLRVEDRCVAGWGNAEYPVYDCSLPDEEILRRAFPPPPDAGPPRDCTRGCDAGSGTNVGVVQGTPVSGGCAYGVGVCSNCYADAAPLDCSDADGGT